MIEQYSLPDVITILFSAIFVIVTFKKLKLSPVIGYIVAGAIIGPYGLNMAGYNDVTKALAEFGVVFLLFAVGLELTFERLMSMKKYIFSLGSAQFFLTTAVFTTLIDLYLNNYLVSLVISASLALSSTAIIFKMLSEDKSSNSLTGKISISVLLMQDLLVIPLFILVPVIGQSDIDFFTLGFTIITKSILALAIIIAAGRFLLRPVMHLILSARYNDLFIATTLLVILASAWVTEELGLSLGLGAFMAGVMIAETEFQPQVETTINQFKGLFLGFFFMTEIGMHFDFSIIFKYLGVVTILSITFVALKAALFYFLCRFYKIKNGAALHSALLLAQGSEFAFVLFGMSYSGGIISDEQFQILSLIVGISMAFTPILAGVGKRFEKKSGRIKKKQDPSDIPDAADRVIIIGYGRVGEIVGTILGKTNIPYIAVDNNLKRVSKFFKQNKPVFYGDINHTNVLTNFDIENVRAIVITIPDQKVLTKVVKEIVSEYPDVPIIARAVDLEHYNKLKKIGANIIIPEVYELGLQISSDILELAGAHKEEISETIESFRSQFSVEQKPI